MNEVKVYDGDGKLKRVISKADLIKRSSGMLNAPPPKKFKNRGRPVAMQKSK